MTKTLLSMIALILTLTTAFTETALADLTILPSALRPSLNLPASLPTASHPPASVLSILDYVRQHVTQETIDDLESKNSGYNRRNDFGGWITTDDTGCLDTRGQVLVRAEDSNTPIKYKDSRNCNIVKGLWHDPYAGNDYKLAKSIQIDHVVPLKHVYVTGGNKWPSEKRCYYANFMKNDFHLLAVSGHENMSKSDKAPDQYMPPQDSFQCQYVAHWMKVKTIWELVTTASELAKIEDIIRTHHCSVSKLQISEQELADQRQAIDDSVPARCVEFAKVGPTQTLTSNPRAH